MPTTFSRTPASRWTAAPFPDDEEERLADLYGYRILDTDPEPEFDVLARLAAKLCGTQMARVNFVDRTRQWTKAVYGMARDETSRETAFCPHTIVAPGGFMVVEDALRDERFARSPLVLGGPRIRFYAGAAIRSRAGKALGSLCVIDTAPRRLDDAGREALRELSMLATAQLELRRLLSSERRLVTELRDLDRRKAEFTSSVAHDFRIPLTSIRGYAELLRADDIPADVALDAIDRGSERLLDLIDDFDRSGGEPCDELVDLSLLAAATLELVGPAAKQGGVTLRLDVEAVQVRADGHRLAQVVENLVGNAVKYSPGASVSVAVRRAGGEALLEVSDRGVGIPADDLPRLFERFFRASTAEPFAGTGVGLATVKAIVEAHGGTIDVESTVGRGSTFTVRLPADRGS